MEEKEKIWICEGHCHESAVSWQFSGNVNLSAHIFTGIRRGMNGKYRLHLCHAYSARDGRPHGDLRLVLQQLRRMLLLQLLLLGRLCE